jgi:hypothetical protein
MPKRARALVEKTMLKQQCNTDYVLEENQVWDKINADKLGSGSWVVCYSGAMRCTRYLFLIWDISVCLTISSGAAGLICFFWCMKSGVFFPFRSEEKTWIFLVQDLILKQRTRCACWWICTKTILISTILFSLIFCVQTYFGNSQHKNQGKHGLRPFIHEEHYNFQLQNA